MTNAIAVFDNPEFGSVRVIMRDGKPWFVAKDVAERLGYSNSRKAVSDHCKSPCAAGGNDSLHPVAVGDSGYLDPQTTLINQSDVLRLIVRSSLPEAERIEKWIFEEVLPSVMETGGYIHARQNDTPEAIMARAVLVAQETIQRLESKALALEAKVEADRPKVLFAEALDVSEDTISVGNLAKLLKQNGVNIGQNRLFEWMRNKGWLMSTGTDWNTPTQRGMDAGHFVILERTVNKPNGEVMIVTTTRITGKGQRYFMDKFLAMSAPSYPPPPHAVGVHAGGAI